MACVLVLVLVFPLPCCWPMGAHEKGSESDAGHRQSVLAGAVLFDAGRFWHAHEAWETGWHACSDPDRDVFKGLIQFAAVQHHLQRKRPGPALALLVRDRIAMHIGRLSAQRWAVPQASIILVASAQYAVLRHGGALAPTAFRMLPFLVAAGISVSAVHK